MTLVADVMNQAARACSLTPPSNWVGNTTTTFMEMKDFLTYAVEEILDRVDLPDPISKDTTITGTGVGEYDLPTDFLRLTRDDGAVYETTMNRRNCIPITTNAEWTHLQELGSAGGTRYYRTAGDETSGFSIEFYRPLETGSSVVVSYVSRNWLKTGAVAGYVWGDNADTLTLPPSVVRLGVIWRFRQKKGLPYADVMAEYEVRLSRLVNDKRGLRVINMGERTQPAHPMRVPVPDYIER